MKKVLFLVFFSTVIASVLISCKEDSVTPPPTITSFTPTDGVVAGTVTITGTNFSITPANNIVKFNGIEAVVTASTETSITTSVPAGATSGTISVTVGDQTVTSTATFRIDVLFKATLSGANERPNPNTSTATGSATLTYNDESNIFTIVITYSGMTATASHIHKGEPSVAGGVVFPFSPVTSPINYTSVALTEAQEADLRAGLYYVNVHSSTFTGGEIRGQLTIQ
ncbi:MAG: CHRD domain-containing protein [Bacteroidia bacterium]|nr:CHRD domain-containing protein [Bacteroidia bacterium]